MIARSEFGPLAVQTTETSLALRWRSRAISDVALGLVVLPGSSASATGTSCASLHGRTRTGGDTVALKWRLPFDENPAASWAEIQLREFSGARDGATARSIHHRKV